MNSAVIDSTWLTILPYDLKEYIWSFNYTWGANVIQKMTKNFIKNKVKNLYSIYGFVHLTCRLGLRDNYYVHYNNKLLNKTQILQTLNSCKCCERHQILKPKQLNTWTETEFHGTQYTPCICACRHLARFICR